MRAAMSKAVFLLVVQLVLFGWVKATPSPLPHIALLLFFNTNTSDTSSNLPNRRTNPFLRDKRKWTSMLTVNPAAILSTLIDHGGLFLPESTGDDIKILRKIFHCEKAQLNVLERTMILQNFTIGQSVRRPAFRAQRLFVYWDSYSQPSLTIEMDNVDILVEFTNLMLTENNWSELRKLGFPPAWDGEVDEQWTSFCDGLNGFVRFTSIDLSGDMTVRVTSRPMQKSIGEFAVDMDSFDDFTLKMASASQARLSTTGRRGCNATEVASLLQEYFRHKVQAFLAAHLRTLSQSPKEGRKSVDRMLEKASDRILEYTTDVGLHNTAKVQRALSVRLDKRREQSPMVVDGLQGLVNRAFGHIERAAKRRRRRKDSSDDNETTTDASD